MKHPNSETWMDYLYKELSATERAECDRHLRSCPECRAEVARWRSGMELLDLDSASLALAKGRDTVRFWQQPALRWAAAAAVVLSLGFGMGRLSRPSEAAIQQQIADMREAVAHDVQERYRQDLQEIARATVDNTVQQQQQWFGNMARQLALQQEENHRAVLQAIGEEILPLRTGMSRLAQVTGQSFSEFANLVSNRLSPEDNATNNATKPN